MRAITALLLWLITTVMLVLAVPTAWVQLNLVEASGFAALTHRAAESPALQTAVAGELTAQAERLIGERGYYVDRSLVRQVATAYTTGSSFPRQFADIGQSAHRWMFASTATGQWEIDVAPMLEDSGFQQIFDDYHMQAPSTLTVPLADSESLRPGQLRPLATWGRWVSIGALVLTGICALLTLAAARRRGKALTGLGISALLAGGFGWAGIEVARRYVNAALDDSVGEVRRIAEVVVATGVRSLHQWLDLTLVAGGVLVVVGMIVAVLGGAVTTTRAT